MKRIDMFLIDAQNDFCCSGNEPDNWPTPFGGKRQGALFVQTADIEAVSVSVLIKRLRDKSLPNGHKITNLHPTIDSHPRKHCSLNVSWKKRDGSTPAPFTIVSHADVVNQEYMPRFPGAMWDGKMIPSYKWALNYTEKLDQKGRNKLCLWPVHCQIGTWGQNFYHPIQEAFDDWCDATDGYINYVTKGDWPWTEHYSGLEADVPDPKVLKTQINTEVIKSAEQADIILWAGWAGSHCLRQTALDAVNFFGNGENEFIKKSVFFEDACAAVADIPNPNNDPNIPKFSEWRKQFLDEVSSRGATVMKTTEFLAA